MQWEEAGRLPDQVAQRGLIARSAGNNFACMQNRQSLSSIPGLAD